MKIKKEHYAHIKKEMSAKLADTPNCDVMEYFEHIKNDASVKDAGMLTRWDLFNAAGLTRYSCDTLYKYLNDTHIDTALKQIAKEIGFIPLES